MNNRFDETPNRAARQRALVIMAKQPAAGQTKTRLCPPLTPEQAADLYDSFLHDVMDIVRAAVYLQPEIDPFIAYTPRDAETFFTQIAPGFGLLAQMGADLGARLDGVLSTLLQRGYHQVAAVSSDIPTLPAAYMADAFGQLDDDAVDLVLGPGEDGGYYLLGTKRSHPRLVRDVRMSTPRVLRDTLALARAEGLRTALLPTWYDVDTVDELRRLRAELGISAADPATGASIAIHTHRFLQTHAIDL